MDREQTGSGSTTGWGGFHLFTGFLVPLHTTAPAKPIGGRILPFETAIRRASRFRAGGLLCAHVRRGTSWGSSEAVGSSNTIRETLRYAIPALSRVRSKSEQFTVMPAARRYPGISGP